MDPALPSDDDLDRLLRPPRRGDAVADALERLRRLDRRTLAVALVGAVAVVVAAVVLTAPGEPAAVELPRAQAATPSGATAGAGAGPVGGAATTSTTVPSELVVHVAGAVARPGLVTVPAGARAADALAAVGGAAPGADLDRMNLASPLTDGSRIYVPALGQTDIPTAVAASSGSAPTGTTAGGASAEPAAPVDLNQATVEQLETLPGVGPATAAAILAHRDAHGPFASIDALDEVRGIGPAKLEQLRPLVVAG